MYRISTLNKIASCGLNRLSREEYEIATELPNPDAIIVRSAKMHDMELPSTLKAIARAGAGTNNIPIDTCSEKGIVVFNTPGANANAVKELVLTSLFLASRKIYRGMVWAQTLTGKGDEIPKLIEAGKNNFVGGEIKGKTLGIIGLGAIGISLANDAISLGMNVYGYDPFISVDAAWGLSSAVKRAKSLDQLLAKSDFITLHIPLTDETKGLICKEKLALMKDGVSIINLSRGGIVNNAAIIEAAKAGKISRYVTDFPEEELLNNENILCIPHLGASTPEAEDNCAIMACDQIADFLEHGNIKNSINFPNCELLAHPENERLIIINKNIPNMVAQITTLLAAKDVNITDMINKNRGDFAYNIINIDGTITDEIINELKNIDGIVSARAIK